MFNPRQGRTLAVFGASLPTWAGGPVLTASRLSGTEKLGKLYEYTLDLTTVDHPTLGVWQAKQLVSADALVGTEITATIEFEGKGTFIPGLPGAAGTTNLGAGRREINGLITKVRCTGADDRHVYYRFTVRPWLWLATRNRENRIFQNQTVIEITESVLKSASYGFPYELRIAAPGFKSGYPKRDYVRQFWQSDFNFLSMLWREWGLYFFMEGSTLVLCDSPGSHRRHDDAYETISYHAPDGKYIDEEHIHKLVVSRELTAGTVSLADYDYTRSGAQFSVTNGAPSGMSFDNAAHYCWGDFSQPLAGAMGLSGELNDYRREAENLARVRVDAMRCHSLRVRGTGNLRGLTTGRTFRLGGYPIAKANAEYLVISTEIDIRNVDEASRPSGGDARYRCVTDFALLPANTFFKNRLKATKSRCTAETAVVVGPEDQVMWIDGYARIKVQFTWDRQGKHNQNSSCWVRVSSPWQGNGFGAIYLPRVGQEVIISYHEGDPDKPYVSDRMVNQFNEPPWELPGNQALTGTRTLEHNGMLSNSIVADDTKGKLQVQVASDYAQSRLVLGYNTRIQGRAGRKEARGEGWELATDSTGVMRANRGMLITTETRAGATAPVKDMGETVGRLAQAQEQHEEVAQLAQKCKAHQPGVSQCDVTSAIKTQNDAIRGGTETPDNAFPELTRPDLVLASAAGIGTTTAESTHMASQQDHAVTAGRDVSISSGRSLFAAVRGAVSIFASRLGMKFVAAKGKIEIQAQSDEMTLAALRDITITSTDGRIVLNAAKEIWIGAGGSYIKINAGGIENCTLGQILERGALWEKQGATGAQRQRQEFFESQKPLSYSQQIFLDELFHKPEGVTTSVKYRFIDETGSILGSGTLDESGKTLRAFTNSPQRIKTVLDLDQGKWTILSYREPFLIPGNETDKADAGVFDYADHEDEDSSNEHKNRSTET